MLDLTKVFASWLLVTGMGILLAFCRGPARVGQVTRGRLVALDSLRGIAAMAVLLIHAAGLFLPPHWLVYEELDGVPLRGPWVAEMIKYSPLAFFLNGGLMVDIFWILSGVVLSLPLLAEGSHPRIAQAAVKRYFRLMPLAFVTIFISFTLHLLGAYSTGEFNGKHLSNRV